MLKYTHSCTKSPKSFACVLYRMNTLGPPLNTNLCSLHILLSLYPSHPSLLSSISFPPSSCPQSYKRAIGEVSARICVSAWVCIGVCSCMFAFSHDEAKCQMNVVLFHYMLKIINNKNVILVNHFINHIRFKI